MAVVVAPGPPDVMGHRKQGQELANGLQWEQNGERSAVNSRKKVKSLGSRERYALRMLYVERWSSSDKSLRNGGAKGGLMSGH